MSIPHVTAIRKERAWLTGERHRHIKEQSIPRYNKEDLGNVPVLSPDVLYFAIEEDEPLVYLVFRQGGNDRENWPETRPHSDSNAIERNDSP